MTYKYDSPLGNNSVSSLKVLFDDKNYYYNFILPMLYLTNDKIFFSDLYKNNALYGLVDKQFNVILPKEEYIVSLSTVDNKQQYLLDFAAEAYIDLKNYLENACILGKVNRSGIFGNIKPYKSYNNPNILIDSAQSIAATEFKSFMTAEVQLNSRIKDHITFNKEFLIFLKRRIGFNMAVSKSEILLSSYFISYSNGVMLDYANEKNCDDDKIKYEKYLSDKDLIGFKDSCKRFGFSIDANIPWRISLDLNSPAMRKTGNHNGYLYKREIGDLDDLFDKRYNRVYNDEIEHLKSYFYNSYIKFLEDNLYYEEDYSKIAGNKIKNRKLYKRDVYKKEQYLSKFDDLYWLRMFAYIRNLETSRGLTQQQFENVVREGSRFVRNAKISEGLKYVNNFFKNYNNVDFIMSSQQNKDMVKVPSPLSIPQIIF